MKHSFIKICVAAALMLCMGAAVHAESADVDMLAVDHRLYELGYRDGACNGLLDEVTIRALKNFQIVNGLEPTGEPNKLTVEVLLGENAVSQDAYLNALAQEIAAQSDISAGDYGEQVSSLQKRLKALGFFNGSSDGAYGAETEAAVCRFQLANGLNETGVADRAVQARLYNGSPATWDDFIASSCAGVGDSGAAVRRLQLWLKQKGYFSGECTGRYGEGTQQAVRRFQLENDLEPGGDLDARSCELLYWDVSAFLKQNAVLRPGDTGAEVEEMCVQLAEKGYPAHGRFNLQTELALMQFQLANGLSVTGVADAQTLECLRGETAVKAADAPAGGDIATETDGLKQKLARQANALLGQYSGLDNSFGFVQYVALKCGMALMRREQLSRVQVGAADTVEAGSFLSVIVQDREIFGVAGADGALIYRADNGYIVMSYLEAMEAENICLYHWNGDI